MKPRAAFPSAAPTARPQSSPGQRPGLWHQTDKALKGRPNPVPMGRPFRACFVTVWIPRALPWAGLVRAFGPAETAKFDALTAEAQRAIALLQERRTALISAAVTGQIDVRGVTHANLENHLVGTDEMVP